MSSKKRKLEGVAGMPQLSAFAARRAKQSNSVPDESIHESIKDAISEEGRANPNRSSIASGKREPSPSHFDGLTVETNIEVYSQTEVASVRFDKRQPASSNSSRAASPDNLPEAPKYSWTTLRPSKDNVKILKDGSLSLNLAPGERLVILGQYDICVQKGQVSILGSHLRSSKLKFRVFAAATHALPVIRCPDSEIDNTTLRIYSVNSGLTSLSAISPLFGNVWNENVGPLGQILTESQRSQTQKHSFQILFPCRDAPQKSFLQPLTSAPEWNKTIAKLAMASPLNDQNSRSILLCGPKSSGKSTFTKMLANRILSSNREGNNDERTKPDSSEVMILDLDPGQPEYSSPGQVSLTHVKEPNFGPPYTHPVPTRNSRTIRSHSIGALSPSADPGFYMSCALDLFARYREFVKLSPECPLIINTPGWVLGTGLELLVDLISSTRPAEIIYMSQEGPFEVEQSLREAAKSSPFYTLPSQASEYTTRTGAQLRTMQSMSYFHLDSKCLGTSDIEHLSWNGTPLTSVRPWEIKYSGDNSGMMGVMCYGEQPDPELLSDYINGSVLSVVVIEDMAAIPGWNVDSEGPFSMLERTTSKIAASYDDDNHELEKPAVIRTSQEDIPYFNPRNTITLDPKHSHTIGLVLVRGIDIQRKRLQVLTPLHHSIVSGFKAGKPIVLVKGKLDTPGWAYTEELLQKTARAKATRTQTGATKGVDEGEGEFEEDLVIEREKTKGKGFDGAPWVEKLVGSQGRGVGARVWRVRRDLGRTGDGD